MKLQAEIWWFSQGSTYGSVETICDAKLLIGRPKFGEGDKIRTQIQSLGQSSP